MTDSEYIINRHRKEQCGEFLAAIQIEQFTERVAIMMVDGLVDEDKAREIAYRLVMG